MENVLEAPRQQVSPLAVKVWRSSAVISLVVTLSVLFILLYLANHFDWYDWISPILIGILGLSVLYSIYEIFIYPIYMHKTWRFDVNEEFIQLKFGALEKTHVLIPMTKVQYVNTQQGPLLRRFNLASITIGTTSSTHTIPAIPAEEAESLRNYIANLAKVRDPK
ncbi:PH domain-containing protein [Bacillus sp. 2205SS5-2]|uniref:PH domain-containing protein n=1 Tax=Bacillus sp. 2205SS5-2 TaxID=3109031 RepID=UPI00300542A8